MGKEITARTFHFLLAKPVSRTSIYLSKFTTLVIFTLITNSFIAVLSFISAKLLVTSDEVGFKYFVLIFTLGGVLQLLFVGFGQLVSIITDETRALLSAAAIAIFGLVINSVANIQNVPDFLKFITPYYYANSQNIVEFEEILTPDIWVLVLAIFVFVGAGVWYFRKKDIYI